jgi:hypothetical protein
MVEGPASRTLASHGMGFVVGLDERTIITSAPLGGERKRREIAVIPFESTPEVL